MQSTAQAPYPASLDVDYPDELDRLSTAFRIIWIIPIAIVLAGLGGGYSYQEFGDTTRSIELGGAGIAGGLVLPVALMIIFRQKYPRWWYDWNLQFTRFSTRVFAYLALLRDEYPSTDEEQAVHLDFVYPDAERDLNRWLPIVKWLLAIPHYIVLFVLAIVAFFAVIIAWFAILFTGRYPRGIFDFIVGLMRWGLRVQAYAFLLVTDRYPPFSMQ